MTASNPDPHDILAQALGVAAQAEWTTEEAEQFTVDAADILSRQTYVFQKALEYGMPRDMAMASSVAMAQGAWTARFMAKAGRLW